MISRGREEAGVRNKSVRVGVLKVGERCLCCVMPCAANECVL